MTELEIQGREVKDFFTSVKASMPNQRYQVSSILIFI